MFKDAYYFVKNCEKYQLFTGRPQLASLPLRPTVIDEPFHQWAIDFIGPLNPPSSANHVYILTTMGYFTKWVNLYQLRRPTHRWCMNSWWNTYFLGLGFLKR